MRNPELVEAKDDMGRTALHWAARADEFNLELGRLLIDKGADLNARDANGIVPLHSLAYRGHYDGAVLLLQSGAELDIRDPSGLTPFLYSILRNKKEVAELLINRGADLRVRDSEGRSALDLAVSAGARELVPVLMEKGLVPLRGEAARNLLHAAASGGFEELTSFMIEKGVETKSRDSYGGTLLHSAATGGLVELTERLITEKVDLNEPNLYGLTPLHLAASRGKLSTLQVLVDNGADLEIKTPSGETAYNLAVAAGYQDAAGWLAQHGAGSGPVQFPSLEGDYLGMKKPGNRAEVFAPGIVSTMGIEHSPAVLTLDGKEIYWTPVFPDPMRTVIYFTRMVDGGWIRPGPVSFATPTDTDCIPAFRTDNKMMFFTSFRALVEGGTTSLRHIWVVERKGSGWGEPKALLDISSGYEGTQVSVARNGNLYFTSGKPGGLGDYDIYVARWVGGRYEKPENLGMPVNTPQGEYDPFIAPDESYLLFTGFEWQDSLGGADLYATFRKSDGSWTEPLNLGPAVNSSSHDIFPNVSPDGKYLFFDSRRSGNEDVYWADARIIERLRKDALKNKKE